MQAGDLVREKTRMSRKPDLGIILKVDDTQYEDSTTFRYQVYFFDGETNWMHENFLERL